MIIPTPQFDPMFADDGIPFRTKMLQYMRSEFFDLLGADVTQLDSDEGLERLSRSIAIPGKRQLDRRTAA
jgi:hypothetical protein